MVKRNKKGKKGKKKYGSSRDAVRKRVKEKAAEGGSFYFNVSDVGFWKPEKDKHKIDVVGYPVTKNTSHGVIGDLYPQKDFLAHRKVGPEGKSIVCPKSNGENQRCPICEEKARLKSDSEDGDNEWEELKAQRRAVFNILVNGEIMLFEYASWNFAKKLTKELDDAEPEGKYDNFADLEEGWTLKVRFDKESFANNSYFKADRIDFEEREDIDESILDQVQDLDAILKVPTYDELHELFYAGSADDKDEEEDEDSEEDDQDEDGDDYEEEEEEDDEESGDPTCPDDNGTFGGDDHGNLDECEDCSYADACEEASKPDDSDEPKDEDDNDEEEEEEKPKPKKKKSAKKKKKTKKKSFKR